MILLQVNITANWGSTGVIAESIGKAALEHGWESYIAYGRRYNTSKSQLIKIGSRFATYTHYAVNCLFDREGLGSWMSTKSLIRQIKQLKPDIVHLHNAHDHYLNYKILFEYLNETDIKVVWTFHDFWAITGHCMHFASVNCDKFQTGCHECPMQKVYPKTLVDSSKNNWELKKSLFKANKNLTIVPVSDWVGENVNKSFLGDKRIRMIPNGVDTSVFKPTPLDILTDVKYTPFLKLVSGKFVIISVASQWRYDKGLEDYIAMAALLKDDEVIVLVGTDEEIIGKLPDKIIGIRRTSNTQELSALYTRADVVTIFSGAETFGLTVIEGYACGTPAVVYNNTAPPSLITPQTGFVVPNKNYCMAYSAIQQIKKDGKSKYHDDCISLARENFDKNKCFEKYIELYEELLKNDEATL